MYEKVNNEHVMKIDKEYLKNLIEEVIVSRREYAFDPCCKDGCSVSYLPTKDVVFAGLEFGYNKEQILKKAGIFEKSSLRTNCKNYCEIYRDNNNIIKMISVINGGKVDCIFQAFYKDNKRFLFPFFENGNYYPTYSFVSKTENGEIVENYKVDKVQIVYEGYSNRTDNSVDYYLINYVPEGSYPVREEFIGKFIFEPPQLEEISSYVWLDDLKKNNK